MRYNKRITIMNSLIPDVSERSNKFDKQARMRSNPRYFFSGNCDIFAFKTRCETNLIFPHQARIFHTRILKSYHRYSYLTSIFHLYINHKLDDKK